VQIGGWECRQRREHLGAVSFIHAELDGQWRRSWLRSALNNAKYQALLLTTIATSSP
jgi:hypothetical protein